ncbi:MAG: PKD domain-containing protein, partial [Bacteroidales bacterium]|nr:PKD domain-containing protein [Bacteroidales bacterium]
LVSPEGDSIIAVEWNFGDPASGGDNVSDQHDPSHFYSQPGTYNITLEATNENYCTVEINHSLQVHALPEADFNYQSYACDSNVYISDQTTTPGEITEWIWHWGDGSVPDTVNAPDSPNISHFYEESGEYEVILEVFNNNGCYDVDTGMVFREPCVMADFELLQDTICQDYRLTFADSSQIQAKINEWEWHFGDGNVTTYNTYRPHVMHTYADTGKMDVSLIITAMHEGNERMDTINRAVYVNPTPTADFVAEEVCEVDSMYFEDVTNTDSAAINSWHWNFGVENLSSDTSAQPNAYYNYTTYGAYDVSLRIMNEFGCRDTITKPAIVHKIPQARIDYDSSCLNDPTRFYDGTDTTGFVGQITDWHWNFGIDGVNNDTSSLEKPTFAYMREGEHQVTLQVEDEYGCRDTTQRTIITHPIPDASFEIEEDYEGQQGRFNLTNTSEEASEYEWDFGALPHHFDQEYHEDNDNPVIVYEDDGTYEIELVAWNEYNCPDTMLVTDSLLFKGLFIPNAFSPNNPQADVRKFKPVGVNIKTYHIKVFDIKGNLLWESTKLDEDGSPVEAWDGTFEGEPLPQGVYVWKAEAVFKDGTVWHGDEVGTSELSSGKTYGTITLIR